MKKIYQLILVLSFSAFAAACSSSDEPKEAEPEAPTITGASPFLYPLFYWGQSPAFIMGKETRILKADEVSNGSGTLAYNGSGDVSLIMYTFTDKEMETASMSVHAKYMTSFLDALATDFTMQTKGSDGLIYLFSTDGTIIGAVGLEDVTLFAVFLPRTESRSIDFKEKFQNLSLMFSNIEISS
ncbi:MAG: hypothetical protein LIP03_13070 [Bacteroidales bacterium]|nr:hypothetical protein [Bacteroidales bacterium]